MQPFDFNRNGKTSLPETMVGIGIVAGLAHMDVENDAALREYQLEERHKSEMRKKQREIDELKATHKSKSHWDDDDDWGGDYFDEDDYIDDLDVGDEIDNTDWDDMTPAMKDEYIRRRDVEQASRDRDKFLKSHYNKHRKKAVFQKDTCLSCVFWRGYKYTDKRSEACQVWGNVRFEHGGAIEDVPPLVDGKACCFFAKNKGYQATCFDCKHWAYPLYDLDRDIGCDRTNSERLHDIWVDEQRRKEYGRMYDLPILKDDCPCEDNRICQHFDLNENLEPAFGLKKIEETIPVLRKNYIHNYILFDAVDYAYESQKDLWKSLKDTTDAKIQLIREPSNPTDPNAIIVLVNNAHGGYILGEKAEDLAKFMDKGGKVEVLTYSVQELSPEYYEKTLHVALTLYYKTKWDTECYWIGKDFKIEPLPKDYADADKDVLAALAVPEKELLSSISRMQERLDSKREAQKLNAELAEKEKAAQEAAEIEEARKAREHFEAAVIQQRKEVQPEFGKMILPIVGILFLVGACVFGLASML